jgi:predicted transglutaminase-like cysteine proteinase
MKKLFIIIIIILLQSKVLSQELPEGAIVEPPASYYNFCLKTPSSKVCIDLVRQIHKQVKKYFIYKHPIKDPYENKVKEVLSEVVFKGNCIRFAVTCAYLLIENEIPERNIKIVQCLTEDDEKHMILLVYNMVLDNRYDNIYHFEFLKYTWLKSMRMDEIGTWRKGI